jgi:hypothetical protein
MFSIKYINLYILQQELDPSLASEEQSISYSIIKYSIVLYNIIYIKLKSQHFTTQQHIIEKYIKSYTTFYSLT